MTNIETNNNTVDENQLLSLFSIEELEERLEFRGWGPQPLEPYEPESAELKIKID